MPLPLLLDSNILSKVVRPTVEEHKPIAATIFRLLQDTRFKVCVPEIIDPSSNRAESGTSAPS